MSIEPGLLIFKIFEIIAFSIGGFFLTRWAFRATQPLPPPEADASPPAAQNKKVDWNELQNKATKGIVKLFGPLCLLYAFVGVLDLATKLFFPD